jgi:hypothetical protein
MKPENCIIVLLEQNAKTHKKKKTIPHSSSNFLPPPPAMHIMAPSTMQPHVLNNVNTRTLAIKQDPAIRH